MTCDDVLLAVLLTGVLDDAATAHVAGCAPCRRDRVVMQALAAVLAADPPAEPPPFLAGRVLALAAPALAANARAARRPDWRRVAAAIAVALVPLPLIVLADVSLLRALHVLLSTVLPAMLSGYLVLTYAATLTLGLAASYAAVPLLAGRPIEDRHA